MTSEKEVYQLHAAQYERLVAREDYQHNINQALNQIRPFAGQDIIELGAGTGRLTRLLVPVARRVLALDLSRPMLTVAAAALYAQGQPNSQFAVADHRSLPVDNRSADIVLAGWSVCYLAVWGGEAWRQALDCALAEMRRVTRLDGAIILLETLGTGTEVPTPPAHLQAYYAYLSEAGFHSTWIRTDYRFASVSEASELTEFFFGSDLAQKITNQFGTIVPECTGIWWLENAGMSKL